MADKQNTSAAKWVILLVVAGLVVAAAMVATANLSRKKQTAPGSLAKVRLKPEILSFAFQTIPNIYRGLVRFNDQILLIDKELERLNDIESEFPNQKTIINAERTNWTRIQKGLFAALSRFEKEVEKIYVTHLVNPDKGKALVDKEITPLIEAVNKTLETSEPQTKRLRVEKKKTFVDRLKEKLS